MKPLEETFSNEEVGRIIVTVAVVTKELGHEMPLVDLLKVIQQADSEVVKLSNEGTLGAAAQDLLNKK